MADKKSQHFVPRFYLRNFATDENGKTISLMNIDASRYVRHAPIKSQACKDYFYGVDPVIENALSDFEGQVASLIARAISECRLPQRGTDDYRSILKFVVIQSLRTGYAVKTINEYSDKLVKHIMSDDIHDESDLQSSIVLNDPVAFNLSMIDKVLFVADDLLCVMIHNRTNLPFITSDNPVIMYNQFLEHRKTVGSNTGWTAKGLQVILPISPRHLLMYYDRDVYVVRHMKESVMCTSNMDDINMLNSLQIIGADMNVYCDLGANENDIRSIMRIAQPYMRRSCASVVEYMNKNDIDPQRSLLHAYKQDVCCKLRINNVGLSKHAKRYKLDSLAVHERNPDLYRLMHNDSISAQTVDSLGDEVFYPLSQ